jgi:hypothetical protein
MMDVNAYIGNWPFRPLPAITPEELLNLLNAEGIGQALVSPIEGIFYDEPQIANDSLYSALQNYFYLALVAVLNPALSSWRRSLEKCHEKYHVPAIKLHPNYHQYSLDSESSDSLLKAAGERDIPVTVQLRVQDVRAQNPLGRADDVNVADAIQAAKTHPETKIIIGGIRWGEAQNKSKEILDQKNLWLDISNIEYTDGLRKIIDVYGTKQLLFGTHAPFFVVRSAILKLKEADLSEEEYKAITSLNACGLFGG